MKMDKIILRNAEEIWNSIPYHDHLNQAHDLDWIHKDDFNKVLNMLKRCKHELYLYPSEMDNEEWEEILR